MPNGNTDFTKKISNGGGLRKSNEAQKSWRAPRLSREMDQLRESVRHMMFGNVGTTISFRVGGNDTEMLALEFGDGYNRGRFSSLGNFEVVGEALSQGRHMEPYLGRTL